MEAPARKSIAPLLFVVSGPSGAGKGESVRVMTEQLGVERAPTYTTRPPRTGEVDGRHYRFVSSDRFWEMEAEGRFLEYNQTYGRHNYASPSELCRYDADTPDSVVELDPNGFQLVRHFSARRIVGLFLLPPSIEVLIERVVERAPETDLVERMEVAKRQLAQAWQYDHLIVNDNLEVLASRLRDFVSLYREGQEATHHLLGLLDKVRRQEVERDG